MLVLEYSRLPDHVANRQDRIIMSLGSNTSEVSGILEIDSIYN